VAFGFDGAQTIEGDKMPEKPTIPSTDILEDLGSLLEKHPELVKIVLAIPGPSSVERLRENLAAAELTLPQSGISSEPTAT
jgi:hypothetical protein